MNGRTFVDTNILIYAHDVDAGPKHDLAKAVLRDLWNDASGMLSMQVLQEFYVKVTRKITHPLSKHSARAVVDTYATWCTEPTTASEISEAFRIEDESGINFWDALIVASAVKSNAKRILSEDLSSGQRVAGILIESPFDTNLPNPE